MLVIASLFKINLSETCQLDVRWSLAVELHIVIVRRQVLLESRHLVELGSEEGVKHLLGGLRWLIHQS